MEWVAVIAFVSFMYMYSQAQRPRVRINRDNTEVSTPQCEDGAKIPVVFGTCPVKESNVTWWGEVRVVKPDSQPNRYFLSLQAGICHGKVDSLIEVFAGEKTLLDQPLTASTMCHIDRWFAFGGPLSGGGFLGNMWFGNGAAYVGAPGPHAGQLSSVANANGESDGRGPGYYGISYVDFSNAYMGTNPQINALSFLVQRIMTRNAGKDEQWLPQYAAIGRGCTAEKAWGLSAGEGSNIPYGDLDDWLRDNVPDDTDMISESDGEPVMLPFMSTDANVPAGLPSSSSSFGWVEGYYQVWIKQLAHTDRSNLDGKLFVYLNCNRKAWVWVDGHCIGQNDPMVDGGAVNLEITDVSGKFADLVKSIRSAGTHEIAIYAADQDEHDGGHYLYARIVSTPVQSGMIDAATLYGLKDMNFVHMLRECLTDKVWGLAQVESQIGDSFEVSAKKLFSEGFGGSILWSEQVTIEEFIKRILEIINATLIHDRYSGKWELRLTRDDYAVEDLVRLDDDWIISIESVKRRNIGSLTSQVIVNYTSSLLGDTAPAVAMDSGLVQAQGGVVSETRDYQGITTHALAAKLAARDLRALSTPTVSCTVVAGRKASRLQPGDAFVLHKPSHGISEAVMRVAEMELGNGRTNVVRLKCVSDVFTAPAFVLTDPEDSPQRDPTDEIIDVAVDPGQPQVETYASTFIAARISDKALRPSVDAVFNNRSGCVPKIFIDPWVNMGEGAEEVWRCTEPGELPMHSNYFGGVTPWVGMRVLVYNRLGLVAPSSWKDTGIYVVENVGGVIVDNHYIATYAQMRRAPDMLLHSDLANGCIVQVANDDVEYGRKFYRVTNAGAIDVGTTDLTWEELETYTAVVTEDKLLPLSDLELGDGEGVEVVATAAVDYPGNWITRIADAFAASVCPAGPVRFYARSRLTFGSPESSTRWECQLCLNDDPENPTVLATAETDVIRSADPTQVSGVVWTLNDSAMDGSGLQLRFRLVTDSADTVVVTLHLGDGAYQTRVDTQIVEVEGMIDSLKVALSRVDAEGGTEGFLVPQMLRALLSPDDSVDVVEQEDGQALLLSVPQSTAPFALYQFARGAGYGIKDSSGNQLDLAVVGAGAEVYGDCRSYGKGFVFDGAKILRCADVSGKLQRLGDLTVAVAFQIASMPEEGQWGNICTIDGETDTGAPDNCLVGLTLFSSGKISIACEVEGEVWRLTPDVVLSTGLLYHAVVSRSGGSTALYLNGIILGTLTHDPVSGGTAAVLAVGGHVAFAPENGFFTGLVQSLALYETAATAFEVKRLYTEAALSWGSRPSSGAAGDYILTSAAGAANGVATLGSDSKLTAAQIPAVAELVAYTTAYEVDFTALSASNLLTGGNGNKTIGDKTWAMANSTGLQAAALADGTHSGLYMRASTANTSNDGASLTGGVLYTPLATLLSALAQYQLHREIWVWVALSTPHVPNVNYETAQVIIFAGTPYTAAGINKIAMSDYYSGGHGAGHTRLTVAGTDGAAGGGTSSARDVYAFRIIDGIIVDTYHGALSGGAWPSRTALSRSMRFVFGTQGGITMDNWHLAFSVRTGNTVGAADVLISKMKVEYR